MTNRISTIAIVVRDYDEAIDYFTGSLGFDLVCDERLSETKRWVKVKPEGSECAILLAKAKNDQELGAVGNQTGGRVFLFLSTDNFQETYQRFKEKGIKFTEEPRDEAYGRVVVFEDLYGNLWDLVEAR